MFAVRESSGVGVNLTWLIPRKVSLPLFFSPSLSTSPPLPPLFLFLSLFPQLLPFSFPRTRRKETGKKNREPGERTASSAPENTGRQFCATVPGGWASERVAYARFFPTGWRSFCSGFNFHSRREKLRRSL